MTEAVCLLRDPSFAPARLPMYSSKAAALCTETVAKGIEVADAILWGTIRPPPTSTSFADHLRVGGRRSHLAPSDVRQPPRRSDGEGCRYEIPTASPRDHLRCICIGMTRDGVNIPWTNVGQGDLRRG